MEEEAKVLRNVRDCEPSGSAVWADGLTPMQDAASLRY